MSLALRRPARLQPHADWGLPTREASSGAWGERQLGVFEMVIDRRLVRCRTGRGLHEPLGAYYVCLLHVVQVAGFGSTLGFGREERAHALRDELS